MALESLLHTWPALPAARQAPGERVTHYSCKIVHN
jgi:hypothetical protein